MTNEQAIIKLHQANALLNEVWPHTQNETKLDDDCYQAIIKTEQLLAHYYSLIQVEAND